MSRRKPLHRKNLDKWLTTAFEQLQREDYDNAVASCRRVLQFVTENDPRRAEALRYLGAAHAMKGENRQAFEAFSESVAIEPEEFDVWYNRGLASLYTSRVGRAFKDFSKAATLCTDASFEQRIQEQVDFAGRHARKACAERGDGFTLERLIEQEDTVQRGVDLMEQEAWSEAEAMFRKVIAMGDVLPQPWGNLGICLLMQQRFDEAEGALRRALEIDPDYKLAKANLDLLGKVRSGEIALRVVVSDPFANARRSVDFLKD